MRKQHLMLIVLFVLSVGLSSCGSSPAPRQKVNSKKNTKQDTMMHESQDREGLVLFYGQGYSRRQQKIVATSILLYTDEYAKAASVLLRKHRGAVHKKISKDIMGSIIWQFNQYRFFGWPSRPDYSQSASLPLTTVSQFMVQSGTLNFTSSITSADGRDTSVAMQKRRKVMALMKGIMVAFSQSSDINVQTTVK